MWISFGSIDNGILSFVDEYQVWLEKNRPKSNDESPQLPTADQITKDTIGDSTLG